MPNFKSPVAPVFFSGRKISTEIFIRCGTDLSFSEIPMRVAVSMSLSSMESIFTLQNQALIFTGDESEFFTPSNSNLCTSGEEAILWQSHLETTMAVKREMKMPSESVMANPRIMLVPMVNKIPQVMRVDVFPSRTDGQAFLKDRKSTRLNSSH